jgi:DNA modification methylase
VNYLYYGDNLDILREHVADESVDLVYLDPPFNSNRSYNVLFREANGTAADAQIVAFDDTWSWGQTAEATLREIERTAQPHIVEMIQAIVGFVGRNDVTAYLVMMTIRLIELHRVLKPTGSIYLHCDPTASHYLKVVMDTIFGKENYQNEIIWRRTSAHSDTRQGNVVHMGRVHDVILYYTASQAAVRNEVYLPYSQEYVDAFYRYVDDDGRRYRLGDITGPGGASKGNPQYEFLGVTRYWRYSRERMQELYEQGRIVQRKPGAVPAYKRYLDEMPGVPLQDLWDDINPVGARAAERLGYPTQKPIELLERIILASSNVGDLVLDPFCGCGTTVCAAQKLGRRWIGIDVTHLAIGLMRSRLRDMFGDEVEAAYQVVGVPADEASANALALQDRHEFEHWALGLIGARSANQGKKGADQGVDGVLYFHDEPKKRAKKVVVQVKSGQVHSNAIRDLAHVVEREKAVMGFLISLGPPTKPMDVEALAAGYYHSPTWNRDYPRIQIRTIAELQRGKGFHLPPANITHAQAQRVEPDGGQQKLL